MDTKDTSKISLEQIESILPQTQCKKCGYDGCKPYAEAVLNGEQMNKCSPGGQSIIDSLANIFQCDPQQLDSNHLPDFPAHTVKIIEADCIGCTKCIQACPVDAIIGSAKKMHTVITSDCTGCDLCIAPCPVDCIERIPLSEKQTIDLLSPKRIKKNKALFVRRQKRIDLKNKITQLKKSEYNIAEQDQKIHNEQIMMKVLMKQKQKLLSQYKHSKNPQIKNKLKKHIDLLDQKLNIVKKTDV